MPNIVMKYCESALFFITLINYLVLLSSLLGCKIARGLYAIEECFYQFLLLNIAVIPQFKQSSQA